jgi:hypothetical protein
MTEPWMDLTLHQTRDGINGSSSVDADDDQQLDVRIPPGEGGTPVECIRVQRTHIRPRFLPR